MSFSTQIGRRLTSFLVLQETRFPLIVVTVMACTVAVYWDSYSAMSALWSLTTYEHCWLIFPASLAILWHKRLEFVHIAFVTSVAGFLALSALVLIWVLAARVGVQVVEQLSVVLMIPATVWALCGWQAVRQASFPLLFLITAVPVGEALIPFLMVMTADIATSLLQLSGVPVHRQGMFLSLPGGEFEVAKVCSGLRYQLAGACITILYAYFTYSGFAKRAIFVSIAIIAFVLANGIRAFTIMYVASATDMRVFTGPDHVYFGLLMFTLFVALLLLVGRRFADEPRSEVRASRELPRRSRPAFKTMLVLVSATFLSGPVAQAWVGAHNSRTPAIAELPQLPGCASASEWMPVWSPALLGPDSVRSGSYDCGQYRIDVYIARFHEQHQGKEMISAQNILWPNDRRREAELSRVEATINDMRTSLHEVFLPGPDDSMLLWYWYEVGGHTTGNEFKVKLLEALHALQLRSVSASLYVVSAEGPLGRDALSDALRDTVERIGQL